MTDPDLRPYLDRLDLADRLAAIDAGALPPDDHETHDRLHHAYGRVLRLSTDSTYSFEAIYHGADGTRSRLVECGPLTFSDAPRTARFTVRRPSWWRTIARHFGRRLRRR